MRTYWGFMVLEVSVHSHLAFPRTLSVAPSTQRIDSLLPRAVTLHASSILCSYEELSWALKLCQGSASEIRPACLLLIPILLGENTAYGNNFWPSMKSVLGGIDFGVSDVSKNNRHIEDPQVSSRLWLQAWSQSSNIVLSCQRSSKVFTGLHEPLEHWP